MAAAIADSRYLRAALEHGGDPNLSTNKWNHPLIYDAIMHRRIDNVALLISKGADVNFQDSDGQTPLWQAVAARLYKVALYLLRAGADPTIEDEGGTSAVDIVMQFGDSGIDVRDGGLAAYDEFVTELKQRGLLDKEPPRTR